MSEYELRRCENDQRSFVERLIMQGRRRSQERYVVRPDSEGVDQKPVLQVTARQRCRATRHAMRTRLVKRLLRRLGLPLGLVVGMVF